MTTEASRMVNYGLRLQITGLTGYYILKNQAEKHPAESPFPKPDYYGDGDASWIEQHGYRAKSGTSVVIQLNPEKLQTLNLRETVEKYLYGARVPIYYNNKRVGQTYEEVMEVAHEKAGERVYELNGELKKKFDDVFPAVSGRYPKLIVRVVPLDTKDNQVLTNFCGVLVERNLV